jgi:N-ethylmaleimide reductase
MAAPAELDLFSPITVGALRLPNRIVMAPLTRNRAADGNVPWSLNATYYAQRASAGLLISEGSQVSPQGLGYQKTPGNYSDAQVAGWRLVTDAVHARGGRIVLQLWHVGRVSHPLLQPGGALPVAPSAIAAVGMSLTPGGKQPFVTPRALETEEIAGIVAQFATGARNAKAAGFDGVEIHGANGYLIDQFIRDGSNHRTDQYGGSLEHRTRFVREVLNAVIAVWGADRVGLRLSPTNLNNGMSDSDPVATFGGLARAIDGLGLAYLHVVEIVTAPPTTPRTVPAIRAAFHGRLMINGGYDRTTATAVIQSGVADLVAFGALYIANPDLVERFRTGAELAVPDRATYYGGDARGYTDYAAISEIANGQSQMRAANR